MPSQNPSSAKTPAPRTPAPAARRPRAAPWLRRKRRGTSAFGEAMALLAGDALQAQAFSALVSSRMTDSAKACALLAHAAGAPGMAGGQAIDLMHVGKPMALP